MRKVIMFNLISLDGFFAGIDGNIDWHVVDDEFNKAAVAMIRHFDTILFGRVTYQLFESYWPALIATQSVAGGPNASKDPKTSKEDRIIANKINKMTKIVFSKTLDKVTWENTKLIKGDIGKEVKKLKQQPGLDIVIYGSGTIVQQLTNLGLIDEYRFMVNPVILGQGKPLFSAGSGSAYGGKNLNNKLNLKLLNTKKFRSGNMLLCYQPS